MGILMSSVLPRSETYDDDDDTYDYVIQSSSNVSNHIREIAENGITEDWISFIIWSQSLEIHASMAFTTDHG